MKIALITDAWYPQVNGVVTTLSHVQRELSALGHEMLVIQPQQYPTFPCPKYPEVRLSVVDPRTISRIMKEESFDACHIATEGPLGLTARLMLKRRGIPFTTSYHTQFAQYVNRYTGIPVSWTFRGLRWFHGGGERTLVPTRSIREELEAQGFRNLVVWTRGVDTDLFKPYTKNLYHLPRPIFAYIGRVAREKNIEAFLDADLPGSKVVVGGGPELAELQRRYRGVRFTGMKHGEELARHYAAADVFVFPSRTDTFGVVLLEAMACGVPVAAYPATGPLDVVAQGKTGFLDEDLERAAVAALEVDPATCREHAMEYSWRRCAEMFLDNLAER